MISILKSVMIMKYMNNGMIMMEFVKRQMLSDLVGLLEDSNVDVRNDAARTVLALTSLGDPWLFATVPP